jgi:crotonobetainyl-CoA:carnitine CoA-transferase CaiB-like acyl-CoA transferase
MTSVNGDAPLVVEQAAAAEAALTGVKVLDLTQYFAGPYCTKLLADYGADVIKIERPEGGDPARRTGPFYQDELSLESSGTFLHLNTNKKSVTVNLETHAGRRILRDLARDSDILVESYAPGVMASWGLAYEDLEPLNSKLIMTSISNFGQSGPYRDYKLTEITMYAMGGTMLTTGLPDRPPLKLAFTVENLYAGLMCATATMGAYIGTYDGCGQHLDMSLMEIEAANQDRAVQMHTAYQWTGGGNYDVRVGGSTGRDLLPVGVYPVADGYVQFHTLHPVWDRVCQMIERPDLIDDAYFTAPENFRDNPEVKAEFDAILLAWLLEHTKQEVMERAQAFGYMCGAINEMSDVFKDPNLLERGFFRQIEHPVTGPLLYPGPPFKMSDTPWLAGRAPLLGEHTREVLQSRLGYSDEDIVRLREQGVI